MTAWNGPRTVVWSYLRDTRRVLTASQILWASGGRRPASQRTSHEPIRCRTSTARFVRKFREQAYVPAEQPSPCPQARIPSAHAHPRRPRRLVVASPQGPLQAVGLSPLLEQVHRMRSSEDFRVTVRRGARAARPTLVTHVLSGDGEATSVGLVVSKSVGTAVVRNRVKRRLRHLVRERLDRFPAGSRVVVRALPPAGDASSATLAHDLDAALSRAGAR